MLERGAYSSLGLTDPRRVYVQPLLREESIGVRRDACGRALDLLGATAPVMAQVQTVVEYGAKMKWDYDEYSSFFVTSFSDEIARWRQALSTIAAG
jgi:hypothetical protein